MALNTTTHLIIVDEHTECIEPAASRHVISARDYIDNRLPEDVQKKRHLRVVNLCQDYGYLKSGYYCSLMAEARGQKVLPGVSDMIHTNWKRIHKAALPELEELLNSDMKGDSGESAEPLLIFFGRTQHPALKRFSTRIFDRFRMPLMKVRLQKKASHWSISSIEAMALRDLPASDQTFFNDCLSQFTGAYWNKQNHDNDKYWLAILHDPEESYPPSNTKALQKFIKIGKKKRFYVELITKHNRDTLLEFDALFIRETTSVNHHTYRIAQKAESEGIPCIDDTQSILRCSNKIYLHELLRNHKIRMPKAELIARRQPVALQTVTDFPLVLKIPDGSFSRGVYKINTHEELLQKSKELFKDTELLLVQEFLPSEYDWRIVILGGQPLLAIKYFMAKQHWQIYNHAAKHHKEGAGECVPLYQVPDYVLATALKAASLIGDGLYGVDVKDIDAAAYVIEVNDNPNLDAGVEDRILGDKLYEAIFAHFQKLIDA